MQRYLILGLSLGLLSACGTVSPQSFQQNTLSSRNTVRAQWLSKGAPKSLPGEIVVQMKKQSGFQTQAFTAFSAGGGTKTAARLRIKDQDFALVKVQNPSQTAQVAQKLSQHPQVARVESNPRYVVLNQNYRNSYQPVLRRFSASTAPIAPPAFNDALANLQWSLPKTGVADAWQFTQGRKELLVAVIDSGVDYRHPDLKGQIINGMDFMAEETTGERGVASPDVMDEDPMDKMGHGTHVAGVIAALPNNQTGIAGIAPGVKVLNIKALNGDGWGSAFSIAQGITYAVDKGAKIINLSLGSPSPSKPIELAVRYAQSKGVLLVAASGNDYLPTGYPARYPGVLAVGATGPNDELADFSNHDEHINVVAPGVDILSTTPIEVTPHMSMGNIEAYYAPMSGTSMATPIVSAQAALLLSHNPQLTAPQIIELIEKTARPLGDPNQFGRGLIQIGTSLKASAAQMAPPVAPPAAPAEIAAQRFRSR